MLCFDGNPEYYDEWRKRSELKLMGCLLEDEEKTAVARKSMMSKMMNGLFGRAWKKCNKLHECLRNNSFGRP